MQAKRRKSAAVERDPLEDIDDWVSPQEFERQFPQIATASAITRDTWHRRALGLEAARVIVKCGRRCLIHRRRYVAYRLGELRV
jgi:hypothetical protein